MVTKLPKEFPSCLSSKVCYRVHTSPLLDWTVWNQYNPNCFDKNISLVLIIMEPGIDMNNIYKASLYLTENTRRLR